MKILFLTDQLYLHGGIERILSQKINYLIDHYAHDVYLLTTEQKNNNPIYDLNSKLNKADLAINYNRKISYFHPKNLLKILFHFFKLYRVITKIQPDIIISISSSPDQYFLPFIHKKIPKLKEFHSSRFNYKKNKSWKQKLDKSFEFYDYIIVLNNDEKKYYNNNNIVVIPNFTDFGYLDIDINQKQKTIIAAGRIAPVKQFNEIIEIWKLINKDFPDWKIKIFGDGESSYIEKLNILIITLNLENTVFIIPATKDIQLEMQKASIYAMTSETECFPMVLLEAQACRLPIVSYNCPNGPRNIINNDVDGFLVENLNRKLFADKLTKLLKSKELLEQMGSNASINVSKFQKEMVMEKWQNLFNNLV